MRLFGLILTIAGAALLAGIVLNSEPGALVAQLRDAGLAVLPALLGLYVVYFAFDAVNWHAAYGDREATLSWYRRIYGVRMVGDAYNQITPTATLGGDALKAWLMKRRYGVPLQASGASLVVARTTSMLALLLFAAIGCLLIGIAPSADELPRGIAYAGFGLIAAGTIAFFGFQYLRISTRLARRAGARPWGRRLVRAAATVEAIDGRIARFYREHPRRLAVAVFAGFVTWVLGTVEVWLILDALGARLAFSDVWIAEVLTQLVRAASFFIPAGLGTQDAAVVLAIGAMSGSPAIGAATTLIRRARELCWVALSVSLGAVLTWHQRPSSADIAAAAQGRD
ncbi:MAG: lysylphosphatidylglycerol synthase transmembrane domain-containing protein [Gammaproteobacteria bacterium]